jgi:hypothetical protein
MLLLYDPLLMKRCLSAHYCSLRHIVTPVRADEEMRKCLLSLRTEVVRKSVDVCQKLIR